MVHKEDKSNNSDSDDRYDNAGVLHCARNMDVMSVR